jgi:cytidylate kinase
MRPRVITIDGAAGSGKSTLARSLARTLDLPYVNTGLMYRALAAAALREGVDSDDEAALATLAGRLRFTVRADAPAYLEVDGFDPAELVTTDVEATVSAVARHARVRRLLRADQRRLGEAPGGAVMEGRDIGSVVFVDAPVKLYLTADPSVRAIRRAEERRADEVATAAALRARDRRDARTHPHDPPPDAAVIDTTQLTVDEALDAALDVVRERAPELIA